MKDRLEVPKGPGTLEHEGAEGPAIDLPADTEFAEGLEDLLAESFEDAIPAGALFEEDVAYRVGVEDECPETAEMPGHRTLARADPANQPDHRDRTVSPGAGGTAARAGGGDVARVARHDDPIHARREGGTPGPDPRARAEGGWGRGEGPEVERRKRDEGPAAWLASESSGAIRLG